MDNINFQHMFSESMYQLKLIENENKLRMSINELLCAESGNVEGLQLLQEGAGEKIKNSILKVWNAIVKMWNTFVHKMEEVVGAQKVFLENNKDVILKKAPRKTNIETYKYNLDMLKDVMPKYDTTTISKIESEESLIKDTCTAMKIPQDYMNKLSDMSISEIVKLSIRGSESPVQMMANDLNMTDLYNYCYDFKTIKGIIKDNINKMNETKEAVLSAVKVSSSEYDKEQQEKQKLEANNKTEEKSNNESVLLNFESISRSFLNEFKEVKDSSSSSSPASTSGSNNKTLSNNMKKVSDQDDPTTDEIKNHSKVDVTINGLTFEQFEDKVKLYYKIAGDILSAQLNMAFEIFTEYMKILRWHVDGFTNKEKKNKDTTTKAGTDYSKDSNTPEVKEEQIAN